LQVLSKNLKATSKFSPTEG